MQIRCCYMLSLLVGAWMSMSMCAHADIVTGRADAAMRVPDKTKDSARETDGSAKEGAASDRGAEGAARAEAEPTSVVLESAHTSLAPARAAFFSGDYDKALSAFDTLSGDDKASTAAVVLRSRILRTTGRDPEALVLVDAALTAHPDEADLLCEKGELLAFVGKYVDAEKCYAAAIEKKDDHLRARLMQAMLYREREDADQAFDSLGWFFDYYGSHDLKTAEEKTLVGCGGFWGGAPEDGFRITLDALKTDEHYFPARLALAEMYLDKGQMPDAERTITKARAVNSHDPDALTLLASLRAEQRRLALATRMCERALAVNPRHLNALVTLAMLSWIDEDDAGALAQLDKVFAINPDYPAARRLQAGIYFAAGQKEAYDATCARIATVQKNTAALHTDTAQMLTMLNRLDDAVGEYRKALEANPDYAGALAGLGMALVHLAQDDAAKPYLDHAFKLDGFNIRTYNQRLLLKRNAEYVTIKSKHFTIRVPEKERDALACFIGQDADRYIETQAARYGWTIPEGLTVMLTRTQSEFAARVTGLPRMDANGVCFGKNVLVVSPNEGIQAGHPFNWSDVLCHELTHTVTVTAADYRIPRWFTEGVSVASQEVIDRNWDIPFATAMHENMLPELATFNRWFNRPRYSWQVPAGYFMAGLFIRWFEEEHGPQAVQALLAEFAKGVSVDAAFASITKVPLTDTEAWFHDKLRVYARTVQASPLMSPKKAKACHDAAVAAPDDVVLQAALMPVAWRMGAHDEALAAAKKVLEKEDAFRKAMATAKSDVVVSADASKGDVVSKTDSVEKTDSVVDVDVSLSMAHRLLAMSLMEHEPEEARVHLEKARVLNADDYAVHLACAQLAMSEEKWQEAIDACEKAAVCYPRYTGPMNSYAGLIAAHDKLEQKADAAAALERYCAVAIDDPDALWDLATRYKKLERLADEERTLRKLFRVNPSHAEALSRMVEICTADHRDDEAKRFSVAAKRFKKKPASSVASPVSPKSEGEEFGVDEW